MSSNTIIVVVRAVVLVVIVSLCVAAIAAPNSLYKASVPALNEYGDIKVGMFKSKLSFSGSSETVDTDELFAAIGFSKAEAYAIQASAIIALVMAVTAAAAFFTMACVGTCTTCLKCLVIFLDILAGVFMLVASAIIVADYKRSLGVDSGSISNFGDLGPGMPLLVVSMVLSIAMTFTSCCFSSQTGYESVQ